MTAFALNGNTYLAVAVWRVQNATTGAFSYSSNSLFINTTNSSWCFVPVQYVPTTAATDCAATTIGNSTFLLFTNFRTDDGLYDINSTLLVWNSRKSLFDLYGQIPTGALDAEFSRMDKALILQSRNTTVYHLI